MKLETILFIITILFISSCNQKNSNEINLTAPKTAYSIPTIIADQKGFFKKNGLSVKINYVNTGKIALDDLIAGQADFSNIVETNIAFAGFLEPEIRVIANIEKVYDASIVARRDKGISKPEDLKNKKLGRLLATTSHVFADRFLEKYGIPKDSVQIENLLPPAMQSAIIEGSGVDAISVWQPYVYNVVQALGDSAIVFKGRDIFTGYMTLAGKKTFMEKNPDATDKLLRSYIEAEEFILNNKEEAIRILSDVLSMEAEVIQSIWSEYEIKISLEKQLLSDTIEEGSWIIRTIDTHKDKPLPDYEKYFETKYLNNISAERVIWNKK